MKISWIGYILRNNRLLKHIIEEREEGWEDQEEDVKSCWITLRKREDTGNWKEEALDGTYRKMALEKDIDLSQDRVVDERTVQWAKSYLL